MIIRCFGTLQTGECCGNEFMAAHEYHFGAMWAETWRFREECGGEEGGEVWASERIRHTYTERCRWDRAKDEPRKVSLAKMKIHWKGRLNQAGRRLHEIDVRNRDGIILCLTETTFLQNLLRGKYVQLASNELYKQQRRYFAKQMLIRVCSFYADVWWTLIHCVKGILQISSHLSEVCRFDVQSPLLTAAT